MKADKLINIFEIVLVSLACPFVFPVLLIDKAYKGE